MEDNLANLQTGHCNLNKEIYEKEGKIGELQNTIAGKTSMLENLEKGKNKLDEQYKTLNKNCKRINSKSYNIRGKMECNSEEKRQSGGGI